MDVVDKIRYGMLGFYLLTCVLAVWGTYDLWMITHSQSSISVFKDPKARCSNIQMLVGHVYDIIDMGVLLVSFVLLVAVLNLVQFFIIFLTFLEVLRKAYAAFMTLTISGIVLCFVMAILTCLLPQASSMPVGLYRIIAHFIAENPYEVCLTPKPIEVKAMHIIEFLFLIWVSGITFGFSALFTIRFYYLCQLRNEQRQEVFGLDNQRRFFEAVQRHRNRNEQAEVEVGVQYVELMDMEMPPPPPSYEQTMAMGGDGLPPRYESLDFTTNLRLNNSENSENSEE